MNYSDQLSKMSQLYFASLQGVLIIPIVCVIAIVFLSRTKIQNVFTSNVNYEKMNSIVHIVLYSFFLIIILVNVLSSSNVLADIPNVVRKEYVLDECVVISPSSAGPEDVIEIRGVVIKSVVSDEEFSFTAYYYPIRIGDRFKVIYYPHSKIGAIIEKVN